MSTKKSAAQRAIEALREFGAVDQRTALVLLEFWKHRAELTAADTPVILAAFPRGGAR